MNPAGQGKGDRRMILHVGTQKTGSTSFQESLRKNVSLLATRGVGVVAEPFVRPDGKPGRRYNMKGLSDLCLRPEILSIHRLRSGDERVTGALRTAWARRRRARDLARRTERDLVLSAEAFCFLRTEREARWMRRFFARAGRRPVILLVTRNVADWRDSWRAELAKDPRIAAGMAGLDPALRIDADWYFDLDAIRTFWGGLGELHEIDYDAAADAEANVVPRLYRAAGIDVTGLDIDVRVNARPVDR